ncbi:aromatic amino acid lyase, partial [Acinetobacter baumannii]
YKKAEQIALASTLITALNVLALEGNPSHFDEVLFAQKPHPGQQHIAKQLRDWLNSEVQTAHQSPRLQDRYSLRCAPHIIGVFEDSKVWLRQFIENELNSSNDNPLIDPVGMRVLHGGHFYGGHIAQAMDSLKIMIANIADLMDRQIAQLVDHKMNHGLPRNLTGATAERLPLNHGFKAVQIGVSAWTAEALKNTLAASIFSRSTECHNQDKVSMGTIAARDASRVITLTQHQKSNNQFSNGFPILLKWPEPESFVQTQYRMHSEHGFQSQAMHSLILSSAYSCNEIDRAIYSAQSQNILN